jgi:hypothetical protein
MEQVADRVGSSEAVVYRTALLPDRTRRSAAAIQSSRLEPPYEVWISWQQCNGAGEAVWQHWILRRLTTASTKGLLRRRQGGERRLLRTSHGGLAALLQPLSATAVTMVANEVFAIECVCCAFWLCFCCVAASRLLLS